ncbi:hypothetical protein Dsin_028994 [Dipteronia sinensis]|uniref:MULE transposase domain-containing protein n=1 Tax=Dipteronia sinensis TaxID=43782 RepID=A0AAD9ZRH6_9ROSI|nr:hypothetical protein Dsin_028994 [Dipteronia sinensis]
MIPCQPWLIFIPLTCPRYGDDNENLIRILYFYLAFNAIVHEGSKDTKSWLLVQCGEHWKGNRFTRPILFSVRLTKKDNGAYDELVEMIYQRTGVSRDKAELKLTSHVKTEDDTVTLSIISDDDVEFVIIHKEKGTPSYKSVSGSNNPLTSQASPRFTSACNDQATPASTTKHAIVDDTDSFERIATSERSDRSKTSDIEDESGDDDGGQRATEDGIEKRGVSGTPNSSSPSMNKRWTLSRSELYSIQAFRSLDMFEKPANQGPLYKGQMFKDKPTLKRVVGLYREVFGDPWESFQRLLAYFSVLEQSNPWNVTKIKTDSKNLFKYGFMAIGASIEEFNSIIKPIICIDATHLKAKTRGVFLVAVCKDGNEMIYHLALGLQTLNVQSRGLGFKETLYIDPISRPCEVSFGSAQWYI